MIIAVKKLNGTHIDINAIRDDRYSQVFASYFVSKVKRMKNYNTDGRI